MMATTLSMNQPYQDSSVECDSALFDCFSPEKQDNTIQSVSTMELTPSPPITPTSKAITFRVDALSDFLQISETRLELDLKITDNQGGNLPAPTQGSAGPPVVPAFLGCGFINSIGATIIKTLEIRIDNVLISSLDPYYAELANMLINLAYTRDCMDTKLETIGCFREADPNCRDAFTPLSGFYKRCQFTNESHVWRVSSPIFSPLMSQARILMPMLKIEFTFYLHEPEYVLLSAQASPTYQYRVVGAKMTFRRVKTSPDYQLAFEQKLMAKPCRYPIDNYYIKSFLINAGQLEYVANDVFTSSFLPGQAYVFLSSNISASYTTSPLDYPPHAVKDIYFTVNQERSPTVPFDVDYANNQYVRAYNSLYGDDVWSDTSSIIDYTMYGAHYCIYRFDLGQSAPCNGAFKVKKLAQCSLHIKFANNNNPNLKVFILAITQEVIEINAQRQVIKSF